MPELPPVPSANQVVAYNLRKARELRGWTQEEAAAELENHLGWRWSKAVWSSAERSVYGQRIRPFDADELVAFARTFDLPLLYFLLPSPGIDPPPPGRDWEPAPELTEESVALFETLLLTEEGLELIRRRVTQALRGAPTKLLRRMNQSWGRLAALVATSANRETARRLAEDAARHRELADQLEHVIQRMEG
jgi:transcriptional regulator with XRE-family HTH domain